MRKWFAGVLFSLLLLSGVFLTLGAVASADVPYIKRKWDGTQVVSEQGICTDYIVIDADGEGKHGGTVTIYGGNGTAKGGSDSAGIGGGDEISGGTIEIYDGTVTSYGGTYAAGIGGGDNANGGSITIIGGTVNAYGSVIFSWTSGERFTSEYGAGIGGGNNGNGGTINIHGGNVTAEDGKQEAGIGGGNNGNGGTINITGGTLEYALGADEVTAPDESHYAPSIPTATDIGSFYVWYRVVGDENHTDLDPAGPMEAVIAPAFGTVDFTLPSSLTAVEAEAFAGIAASAVEFPASCASIGDRAFSSCPGLTQIRIPKNCTLGTDVFSSCVHVSVYGAAGSPAAAYCEAFDNCVFVEEEQKETQTADPPVIPSTVQ